MTTRRYRVLWLPTLAVLLPCIFILVLGYKWLALEREAARHRSAQAEDAIVADLRLELSSELQSAARAAASALSAQSSVRGSFQAPPSPPPLVEAAFLVAPDGTLLPPDPRKVVEQAVTTYRSATAKPSWQQAYAEVLRLEAAGQRTDALDAARSLLANANEPALRASALVILARIAALLGHHDEAERYARQVGVCCAEARDETGTPFVLYAAWQRALVFESRSAHTIDGVIQELLGLVDRGQLGAPADGPSLNLLASKLDGRYGSDGLAARINVVLEENSHRGDGQALAARLVGEIQLQPVEDIVLRTLSGNPRTSAAVSRTPHGLVVLLLDQEQIALWVRRWAGVSDVFSIALASEDASLNDKSHLRRLAPDTPGLLLDVRQRARTPATERSRRLLMFALAGVLALTLAIGYFAARDVLREVRTASLRSSFVASVTHELKTPLASIRLLAETMRAGRVRSEVTPELLGTIVEEADHLTRLVDNVLASARLESGTRRYEPRMVLMGEAVREALARLDYVLKKEGFTVAEHIPPEPLSVRADPDALGQAVLNLVGNAVKYSGQSREISVTVGRQNGHVSLSVADRGIGIAAPEHQRVFESFYRTQEASAQTAGAGLGLSLVRHFAEAHGGGVGVESAPGAGSVFSIWLPIPDERRG